MAALAEDLAGTGQGSDMFGLNPYGPDPRGRPQGPRVPMQNIMDNREYVVGGDSADGMFNGWQKRPGLMNRMSSRWNRARGGGGGRGGRGGGGGRGGRGPFDDTGGLSAIGSVRRVLFGAGVYQGAQEFGQLADTYTQLQMRLNGLTGSQEKTNVVFDRLRGIASSTNSSLETTTEGYVRIMNATSEMNLSQEDSFKLMTNLNTMLVTSGASTQEASSGMRQLTQAFASNKLAGDEFKSIAENMPNILKALQKATGKTEGQLRAMSEAGQINRKMLVNMLLNLKDLQQPVDTFGSTWQKFKDNLMVTFGEMARDQKLVEKFKSLLVVLFDVIKKLAEFIPVIIDKLIWFAQGLKDGEAGAIALATAIGVMLLPSLFRLLAFPFLRIASLIRMLGAAWNFAGAAARFFGLSTGAAAGGDALAMMGGGAGAAKKGGGLGKLGGLAAFAGRALPPLAVAIAASELTGGSGSNAWLNALGGGDKFLGDDGRGSNTSGGSNEWLNALGGKNWMPTGAGSTVNMGGVTVSINAQDGTDAAQKFVTEMENKMRQAGATFNR